MTDPRIPADRRILHTLQALTGMRIGEACGRRWRDYDRETPGARRDARVESVRRPAAQDGGVPSMRKNTSCPFTPRWRRRSQSGA